MGLNGAEPNGTSSPGRFSPDGQFVSFDSAASNFVADDTNARTDAFLHKLPTEEQPNGATIRVSVPDDAYKRDNPEIAGESNGNSWPRSISADNDRVVFYSAASNLVPGDTNGVTDVFVRELSTGRTIRVSVASDGAQANGGCGAGLISADGRYVAFESDATNLVPGDTNALSDVFVHDMITGKTTRVNVACDGTQANKVSHLGSISADGRFVAFYSDATNLVPNLPRKGFSNVFVRDCWRGTTTLVSVAADGTTPGNNWSRYPRLNADGSLVVFQSLASNLVASDATADSCDIYLRDLTTGQTSIVSVASDGTQATGTWTTDGTISPDGRYVGFTSNAGNLPGGGNGSNQVYVHDLGAMDFAISTTELPDAVVGQEYRAAVVSIGGTPPYYWDTDVVEGTWPAGLSLDPDTGVISGTPQSAGTVTFWVGAFESEEDEEPVDEVMLTLTVRAAEPPPPPPPAVDVTVVSVVARDIRLGAKYNITATIRNNGTAPVTVSANCTILQGSAEQQSLPLREVAIGAGATAQVKFDDVSTVARGTYTAAVGVDGTDAILVSAPFRVK